MRFIFAAICCVVLLSFGTTQKVSDDFEDTLPPQWVQRYPIDPQYFIGIASAPITPGSAEHISKARDAALAEIAASITVQIVSESESHIREENQFFSHTFEERISSFAKQDLEGYELVDSWEGDHHYWVYYRLCRDLYRRQKEEKINIATRIATDLIHDADKERQKGNQRHALFYYFQAYNNIGDFIGYGLESTINEQEVFLENHIWGEIQNITGNLKIEFIPSKTVGMFLGGLLKPVEIKVRSDYLTGDSFKAVPGMPLAVYFLRGSGELSESIITGDDGTTNLSLTKINSPLSSQVIKVKPDPESIAGNMAKEEAVAEMISNISLPEARLEIDLRPVTVCLDYTERGEYNEIIKNSSRGTITSSLSRKGFEFTDDIHSCNYFLKLDANLRRGTVIQNIHTAFCDATVYFIDEENVELMSFSVRNISGADLSFIKAKQKAIENSVDKLVKQIKDELF